MLAHKGLSFLTSALRRGPKVGVVSCRNLILSIRPKWGEGGKDIVDSGVSHHLVAFPLSVLAPSHELAFGSTSSRTKGDLVGGS